MLKMFQLEAFHILTDAIFETGASGVPSKSQKSFICDGTRQTKEWEFAKETKVNSEVLLIKSSGIILNFLPAFYLIIWLMESPKNFEKTSILKI